MNRLTARLEKNVVKKANEASVFFKKAPDRLKKELDLLKNEIIEEAERMQQDENEKGQDNPKKSSSEINTKIQINQIRTKLITLSRNLEDIN